MSYLNNVSHTQDIEAEVTMELDLLDLVYKNVESVVSGQLSGEA